MPRLINLQEELRTLREQPKKKRRQFVMRLNTPMAITFILKCIARDEQPGPLLEEIVTEYFRTRDHGVQLGSRSADCDYLTLLADQQRCTPRQMGKKLINALAKAEYLSDCNKKVEVEALSQRSENQPTAVATDGGAVEYDISISEYENQGCD